MVQIQQEEKSTRKHFRLIVGAAAASLIAVAGAAAVVVASKDDSNKPDTVVEQPTTVPDRSVPNPDELVDVDGIWQVDAETVQCASDPWSWARIPNPPPAEPLTVEMMKSQCAETSVAGEPSDIAQASACIGDGQEFPVVVIALRGDSCDEAPTEGGYTLRPMDDADLAEINHLRAIEFAFNAVPGTCARMEDVVGQVRTVMKQEGLDLEIVEDDSPVVEPPDSEDYFPCPFVAETSWEGSTVTVHRSRA